ncbi:MerR family transcriptional regulator [Sphingomicrobium lutaoense]|uniref:MerR family mercuric resistance operon transcriptional regulator n=1 Tax=Sphingomicrobium lutaoense TaxID=515949 RepID=A0A839Z5Z7_9SPHN|nr:MerR family transcriptional regulator [Sphingomicrobium lutaoense]MBB3764114.1 MerR family mercuric resistance operon transcriptional regulator [Sphingomicrobium lutaoense]
MENHSIGSLARAAGIGVETVRFYQRKGLLDVPPRAGSIRRYGADHLDRLRFIRRAKEAGFTLGQIGELIALDRSRDRARILELASERVAALDAEIAQKIKARDRLADLSSECGSGRAGPCPIIEAFL